MKALRTQMRTKKLGGFTLVEIMIVVLIIGILLAIAIPNFVQARESSRARACVANLKQIDSATQQYAMDNKLGSTATVTGGIGGLVGTSSSGYLKSTPSCPAGGTEAVGTSISASPTCTISPAGTTGDYGTSGKWYHGLPN